MSRLEDFKVLIFSDSRIRTELINTIIHYGYDVENFNDAFSILINKVEDRELQLILAPYLRKLAIKHLRDGTTTYVKELQKEYDKVLGSLDRREAYDAINFKEFLKHQSQPFVYGTDIEAGALAELLGVTFSCTQVDEDDLAVFSPCVYYKSSQENAVIFHLYNRPGVHFFIEDGKFSSTIGDGNCLYNGFAQLIRQLILIEEHKEIKVYIEQARIYEQIKNIAPLPVAKLIAKVNAEHLKKEDKIALAAAVAIAKENERPSLQELKELEVILTAEENKLLDQIKLIGKLQVRNVNVTNKASELANSLESIAMTFFKKSFQDKQTSFNDFKITCIGKLNDAKKWAKDHSGYKQIFINFLQALTIIGVILGAIQWVKTGRYSFFPLSSTRLIEKIEATARAIEEIKMF